MIGILSRFLLGCFGLFSGAFALNFREGSTQALVVEHFSPLRILGTSSLGCQVATCFEVVKLHGGVMNGGYLDVPLEVRING